MEVGQMDIAALRAGVKKLLDRDVAEANRRYAERIKLLEELTEALADPESVEMLESMASTMTVPRKRIGRPPGKTSTNGDTKLTPTMACRMAIRDMPVDAKFTMPQIARWIEEHHPHTPIKRPHLSSALHKLKSAGEIEQVTPPMGRDPAIYKRTLTVPLLPGDE